MAEPGVPSLASLGLNHACMRSPELMRGRAMRHAEHGRGGLSGPLELIKQLPGEPCASSAGRQWVGLEARRYRDQPPNEAFQPPLTHHTLLLFNHTPKEF